MSHTWEKQEKHEVLDLKTSLLEVTWEVWDVWDNINMNLGNRL
jgi:hypothetical protein